jgi:GNAT superfamily N-acetyltransferase
VIEPIRDNELADTHAINAEYLDETPNEVWKAQRDEQLDLYLACRVLDRIVGICYGATGQGHVTSGTVILQGIAVVDGFSRAGRGSQLLQTFETQVRRRGCHTVSLGSAGGCVDQFYQKNGYRPTGYMICAPADRPVSEALMTRYPVYDEHLDGDLRRSYVRVCRLDESLRNRLQTAFAATEVVAIMAKTLSVTGS